MPKNANIICEGSHTETTMYDAIRMPNSLGLKISILFWIGKRKTLHNFPIRFGGCVMPAGQIYQVSNKNASTRTAPRNTVISSYNSKTVKSQLVSFQAGMASAFGIYFNWNLRSDLPRLLWHDQSRTMP